MVPTSVFKSMAGRKFTANSSVCSVFCACNLRSRAKARPVLDFLQSTCEIMFKFTEYVMYFAPIGVFGAISATIGQNGIGILANYAKLIGITYFSLILFVINCSCNCVQNY